MKYVGLVLSGLLRRKLRTGLTLLALLMAFTLLGLLQAVNSLFGGAADFLGANRLITQASTSFTQPLPMRLMPQIEAVPGVESVMHSQFFGGVYQDGRGFFPQFAVNPQRLRDTYPEWVMAEDGWRQFISTRDGAIVGRNLAETNGWKVGDIIPLNSFIWTKADGSRTWEWRVVGIFEGRDEEWDERANVMYLNYGQFDEGRSAAARGLAGIFAVRIADPNEAARIAAEIDAKFDNSSDETKTQSEQEFQLGFARQFGDIGAIVNLITAAVFFSILFLTGVSMSQAVRERIPELAVLKCLGFTDRQVMWLVLAEAFALCLLGALAGMLLASALTLLLPPEFPITTDLRVWIIAGISVLVLTVMIGMPPALTAKRLKIVDALAGRGDDSPLERLLHRGLDALTRLFGRRTEEEEAA
ncbi:ABC transporter permease [Lysobacter brunescens]|uniref:ABC transporter permease n=1 Tax=Lysobacter brunescens TaxID=262323 RepID=A0ABW2Y728_9GAMM